MFNVFPHVQSIRQQYKDSRILLDFQWFASSCNVLCDIPTAAQHWAVEIGLPYLESPNLPSNPQSSMNAECHGQTFQRKRCSYVLVLCFQGGEGGRDPHLFGPWNLGRSTSSTAGWDHPRSAHSTVSRSCEGDDGHLFAMVCCWRRVIKAWVIHVYLEYVVCHCRPLLGAAVEFKNSDLDDVDMRLW